VTRKQNSALFQFDNGARAELPVNEFRFAANSFMHHFSVHWIAYADLKFASREHNSVSRQGSKSCCRPCFVFGWAQGLSRSALSRFWPLFMSLFGTLVAAACSRLNLRTYFSFPQIWLSIIKKINLLNKKKNK
jgi:hypothetical protein